MIHFDPSVLTMYDVLIQKNQYEIDKGYIFSDYDKGNLYQVGGTTQSTVQHQNYGIFFTCYFRLGSESKMYKSRVFKFLDALGTIGGVYELSFGILSIIFAIFNRKLYFYHMVNQLKGFESRHKRKLDEVTENTQNQNSQNVNRTQQHRQNIRGRGTYSSMVRSINNKRHNFNANNISKIRRIDIQK